MNYKKFERLALETLRRHDLAAQPFMTRERFQEYIKDRAANLAQAFAADVYDHDEIKVCEGCSCAIVGDKYVVDGRLKFHRTCV